MKKVLLAGMAFLLAAALCSCGGGKSPETTTAAANTTAATAKPVQTEKTDAPPSGSSESGSRAIVSDGSRVGVLQEIPGQNVMKINGLILTTGSGHHDYSSIEELYPKGYKTEGLNSEYYLNEWISLYGGTDDTNFQVYIAPSDPDKDYSTVTAAEIDNHDEKYDLPSLDIGDDGIDKENNGHIGDFYINPDRNDAGLYNVFFVKSGKVAYMLQITLVPMSEE